MPNSAASSALTFYPAFCFSLSPTYNAWVKLSAAGLQSLQERRGFEGQNVFFYLNHPIQWVQLAGTVVSVDHIPTHLIFHIDDGSGSLAEVVMPRESPIVHPEAQAGQLISLQNDALIGRSELGNEVDFSSVVSGAMVKVKGGIKTFRGEKQVLLERLFVLSDTMAEVQFWTELSSFFQSTLSIAWVVTSEEQRSLKEQERKQAKAIEAKKARKKARESKKRSNAPPKQARE